MSKKKQGFTLIELLAVIVILAIILLIAVPSIMGVVKKAKEETFNNQVSLIKEAAKNYMLKENASFDESGQLEVTLKNLQDKGLMPDEVIDPRCKNGKFINDITAVNIIKNQNNSITYDVDAKTTCAVEQTNILSTSSVVDNDSITVTVIPEKNDIIKYKYQLNTTPEVESTLNSHTFTNLDRNQDYNVKVTMINTAKVSTIQNMQFKTTSVLYQEGILNGTDPVLDTGMIPIKYDGSKWVKADSYKQWYKYSTQEWANVALVTSEARDSYLNAQAGTEVKETDILAYLVWIPRYSYKLWNANNSSSNEQDINIKFVGTTTKEAGSTNGTYLTHPAFTFGNKELAGFWVGKFETTCNDSAYNSSPATTANYLCTTPSIKPNMTSLRNQNVSTEFTQALKFSGGTFTNGNVTFSGNSTYGLTSSTDSHMMKNMEWGAVAYLSHSKYGKYGNPIYTETYGVSDTNSNEKEIRLNNSSTLTTGCAATNFNGTGYAGCENTYHTITGIKASTTGNITGIYDMNGGAVEDIMGNMKDSSGKFYPAYSGFTTSPPSKYYDIYAYDTLMTTHDRGLLGDATKETLKIFGASNGGWYQDYVQMPFTKNAWVNRSGHYSNRAGAGIFYISNHLGMEGVSLSFRTVLAR